MSQLVQSALKPEAKTTGPIPLREEEEPYGARPPSFTPPQPEDYLRTGFAWRTWNNRGSKYIKINTYERPHIQWEFMHPELPIIRVAATYDASILPYTIREDIDWERRWPRTNRFTIEFVIAFQHRWTSFSDPDRWAVKFRNELNIETTTRNDYRHCSRSCTRGHRNGFLDPEQAHVYPNYWHTTDYMQHSLIGPVVMTVPYDSNVLKEGVYSQTPEVTQWQAPGPIITKEQSLTPMLKINEGEIRDGDPLTRYKQKYPFTNSPNPGYPLPGHVLTYNEDDGTGNRLFWEPTGPGSRIWQEYNLGPEWK